MRRDSKGSPEKRKSGEARKLPVALDAFTIVRDMLIAGVGDSAELRQALLACDEWIANVANYSRADAFSFSWLMEGRTLYVCFSDNGIPFDPTRHVGTAAEFENLDLGGMGLSLIRESAADMAYERVNGQNMLGLYFAVPSSERTEKEESPT